MTENTKDILIENLLNQIELLKQEITDLKAVNTILLTPALQKDKIASILDEAMIKEIVNTQCYISSHKEPSLQSHLIDQEIAEHSEDGKANWHNLELDCLRKDGLIL